MVAFGYSFILSCCHIFLFSTFFLNSQVFGTHSHVQTGPGKLAKDRRCLRAAKEQKQSCTTCGEELQKIFKDWQSFKGLYKKVICVSEKFAHIATFCCLHYILYRRMMASSRFQNNQRNLIFDVATQHWTSICLQEMSSKRQNSLSKILLRTKLKQINHIFSIEMH